MKQPLVKFSFQLILILALVFGIHILTLYWLEFSLFENKIVLAYIINVILAIIIYGFLLRMKKKFKEQVGLLFIGASTLKFVIFFIFFYGSYKADGTISKLEFAAFFVPYLLCLVIETSSLAKWLNKLE